MHDAKHTYTDFSCRSGSANPCPTHVHMEPFSTTVFKGPIWIFATTTKICSNSYYTTVYTQDSLQAIAPTYTLHHHVTHSGKVSVARLSAIHFQGWSIRQVSCYTFLSRFRLPWPPSCCSYEPTPFMVSNERALQLIIPTLGSPLIANSAYQKRPT